MSLASVFSDIANSLKNKVYIGQGYEYSPPSTVTPVNYTPPQIAENLNKLSIIDEQGMGIDKNLVIAGIRYGNIGEVPKIASYEKVYRYESSVNMGTTYNSFVDCDTVYVGLSNANNLFKDKTTFNKKVMLGNNVTSMYMTFYNCYNFNQPITIPDSVVTLFMTFNGCTNFNQPITIPNSVTDMTGAFQYCYNFNQPINIPNGVTAIRSIFACAEKFNQPLTIPEQVTSIYGIVYQCHDYNYALNIPNNVTNMRQTFSGCYHYNQTTNIPSAIIDMNQAFEGCIDFENNIYFSSTANITNCQWMLANCNNSKRKNIYCPDYTPFLQYNDTNSIVGADITWSTMDNGVYNSAYNIYIYNNYTPA